jgi:hypothetical protein
MLGAAGVNHHWRSVASAALLNDSSWQGQATIRHPAQLSTLVSIGPLLCDAALSSLLCDTQLLKVGKLSDANAVSC